MLRDPNLVPLSRQHHHALALCVRIDRALAAGPADLGALQSEIEAAFAAEMDYHFQAEEEMLFPRAARSPQLAPVVAELKAEHERLRHFRQEASHRQMSTATLAEFSALLVAHVRKEERVLFEALPGQVPEPELNRIGRQMNDFFHSVSLGATCLLPPRDGG